MVAADRDRWNTKWAEAGRGTTHGSTLIDLVTTYLPSTGTVLDIAGGGSPNSLMLARRGLAVTVADISDVGLAQARQQAQAEDLLVHALEIDFDHQTLPNQQWDVITVSNYLNRDLLGRLPSRLAHHGIIAVVIATTTNLERHDRPGPEHLVALGELPKLVTDATVHQHKVELVDYHESWRANGRHEAHLIGRKISE